MKGKYRILLALGILGIVAVGYWTAKDRSVLISREASPSVTTQISGTKPVEAETALGHPQFQKKALEVKQLIPTQEQIQKLTPEEVHFTPKLIQRAALGLGEMAQMIADKPELAPEGIKFYRECAETESNPVAIRASCFASHEQLMNKYHLHEESLESDERIDATVKNLAKKL